MNSTPKDAIDARDREAAAPPPTPVSREQPIALSYAQDRYWLLSLLEPNSASYTLTAAQRLRGPLAHEALRAALTDTARRHETLRTVVAADGRSPALRILPAVEPELKRLDCRDEPDPEQTLRAAIADLRALPFDLKQPPLWRGLLATLGEDDHVLVLIAHRIAIDERSMALWLRDLGQFYGAHASNAAPALPELPLQFADFASWQCAQCHGDGFEGHGAFWRQHLAGELPVLELPTDHPRPPRTTYDASSLPFALSGSAVEGVERLCSAAGVEPLVAFVSALAVVLGRSSGLTEVMLGMPAVNRARAGLAEVVGRLATILPLRIELPDTDDATALLRRTRAVLDAAIAHQEIPFERILELVPPPRDLSRHPYFQVVIEAEDDDEPRITFPGLEVSDFALETATVMFDLHLRLSHPTASLAGKCTYARRLFEPARVERMLGYVERALCWLAEHPDRPISELVFLSPEEIDTLVVQRNATARSFPAEVHVHELFEAQAARTPDATAVVCGDQRLTYRELNQRANQLARYLQDLGVGLSDRVGICMERSVDTVVALFGTMKAGGVYVPIDPQYPSERQAYMVTEADAKVVLGQAHLADRIPQTAARTVLVDAEAELGRRDASNLPRLASADPLLYMIFTSGSTGKPKGSLVYHRGFVNLLTWYRDEHRFDSDSRFLVFTSLSFDLTQKNLFTPLATGGLLGLLDTPHYDAARILDLIEQHAITVVNCTPSAFYGLLANTSQTSLRKLRSLRFAVLGGESIALPRLRPWLTQPWCNAEVVNSYGPTECTDVCAFHRIPRDAGDGALVPIGRPITNTQLFILDAGLRLVPDGAAGELCIGGVGVGAGYLNRPELNEQKFVLNPYPAGSSQRIYRTGDRVRYLPNGDIDFLGRIDHQVKIRGFRIELGEITTALEAVPEIAHAYVMPREDAMGDLSLVAYVVPRVPTAEVSIPEVRGRLAQGLPDYMVPSTFVVLEAMPLSPNGKVDRTRLPPPAAATPAMPSQAERRSEAEEFVAEQWRSLLGVERVGNNERFFDLGGTSLKGIQFVGAMGQELGISLPMVTLFEAPTVAEFVATLRRRYAEAFARRFPTDRAESATGATADESNRSRRRQAVGRSDIAIIGMAVRVPGADSLDDFWQNLREGVESVRTLSDEELLAAGVTPEELSNPGYVKAAAVMNHLEDFDGDFFRLLPRELDLMDPQHRAVLECAYTALDHAGYAGTPRAERVGVFAGVARDAYLTGHLLTHRQLAELAGDYSMMIGNEKDFPATRVAYRLNLRGPAMNVQSACSSSGVALHLACQSLNFDDCDMALVGGCRVLTPVRGYLYVDGGTLSPDGHVRAFDAKGRGMIRGSGVGFVVVKRLDRALEDGDHVYAVVKGSAVNNDGGAKVGFTAPSVPGQAAVIREALARADVHPDTISYIEAHGTGTALGDPIEVTALTEAYREHTQRREYCAVGSVKTNIGHLDAGSCVVGVIKTVLAMNHGELPPSLNFESPNPQIDFANSPFFVNAKLRDWRSESGPRRAGVSSFGLGGTNVHVILEEAPQIPAAPGRAQQLLVLSAKTSTALDAATDALAAHLERHPEQDLADVAYTLQTCRAHFEHRRVLVADPATDAAADLRARRGCRTGTAAKERPSCVFMFPGQGAQHVGMGQALYESEPHFRRDVDACAELLQQHLHVDLRRLMFASDGDRSAAATQLQQTALAQPAIFTIGYASARLLLDRGVTPDAMIGHSVGEFAAACLAGVFSLEDALMILAERARLMQSLPRGGMRAVPLSEAELAPFLTDGVSLAAVNAPQLCVVSGPDEAIAAFDERLQREGASTVVLHTSHAFHSSMMDPIVPAFTQVVARTRREAPQRRIVSTVSGTWLTPEQAVDPGYWATQLRRPVRFSQAFATARDGGPRLFVDVGPSTNLASAAQRHVTGDELERIVPCLPRAADPVSAAATFAAATGRCWLLGAEVDFGKLSAGEQRRRVGLPGYPFERKRYWVEPTLHGQSAAAAAAPSERVAGSNGDSASAGHGVREAMAKVFADQVALMAQQLAALGK